MYILKVKYKCYSNEQYNAQLFRLTPPTVTRNRADIWTSNTLTIISTFNRLLFTAE